MNVAFRQNNSAARRARDKAETEQIRFVHLFYGRAVLARCGGKRINAYGTASEFIYHRHQYAPVCCVESVLINSEHIHRCAGTFEVYCAIADNLRIIARASKKSVSYSRSSS